MEATRSAQIHRVTAETDVSLSLGLDGAGQGSIDTGIGFLDHMLTALARHASFDLEVKVAGDLHVDFHHTTEDVGIVLGQALTRALGNKAGIRRYGHAVVPMDDELFEEFFRGLAGNAGLSLHVTQKAGTNNHHIAEACFKAVARALRQATEPDPRSQGRIPSTKGSL